MSSERAGTLNFEIRTSNIKRLTFVVPCISQIIFKKHCIKLVQFFSLYILNFCSISIIKQILTVWKQILCFLRKLFLYLFRTKRFFSFYFILRTVASLFAYQSILTVFQRCTFRLILLVYNYYY